LRVEKKSRLRVEKKSRLRVEKKSRLRMDKKSRLRKEKKSRLRNEKKSRLRKEKKSRHMVQKSRSLQATKSRSVLQSEVKSRGANDKSDGGVSAPLQSTKEIPPEKDVVSHLLHTRAPFTHGGDAQIGAKMMFPVDHPELKTSSQGWTNVQGSFKQFRDMHMAIQKASLEQQAMGVWNDHLKTLYANLGQEINQAEEGYKEMIVGLKNVHTAEELKQLEAELKRVQASLLASKTGTLGAD